MEDLWVITAGIGGLLLLLVMLLLVFQFGSKLPFLKGMYHESSLRSGRETLAEIRADAAAEEDNIHDDNVKYVGCCGVAATALRPAGKVRLDSGELIDVVTEGDIIARNARVKVLEARMNRIVVAPAPKNS